MATTSRRPVRPPAAKLQLMEAAWLPVEAAGFWAVGPWLRMLGRGDHHPVLLLPGFGATDESTVPLRMALRSQGYWAHSWHLGRNLGPTSKIVTGMRARLQELHDAHGRRVSLVGQSLGGVFARHLAREQPDVIRQVITLGSPYRMIEGDRSAAQTMWEKVSHLHDGDLGELAGLAEQDRPPLVVPATSIYSRTDGVAPWQTCIDEVREHAENIEVRGSHVGMGVNPAVLVAVLDRLSQPEDDWRPFASPLGLRSWYPKPAGWHERRPPRQRGDERAA
jgi:pimeloyl-ACP methyl ester carboxylesterase